MPDILVRPAIHNDIAAITAIYGQAVREGTASFELDIPDEAEMSRRYEDLRAAGYPYVVAEHQGLVLGYAYAGLYRARPAFRWTVEDSVYVDVAAQRRGVGRALLARLIAECEARGFRQMIAVIGDTDNIASVEMHRTAGFRMVGTLENVGCKFGRWLDCVLMQRPLGTGALTPP